MDSGAVGRSKNIKKYLLTANMVIDKNLLANVPLWIPSLDANNMFDRVNSDSLWKGLLHPLGNFLYKMGEGRRFTQNHFVRKK